MAKRDMDQPERGGRDPERDETLDETTPRAGEDVRGIGDEDEEFEETEDLEEEEEEEME